MMTQEIIDRAYDGFILCNPNASRKESFVAGTKLSGLSKYRPLGMELMDEQCLSCGLQCPTDCPLDAI